MYVIRLLRLPRREKQFLALSAAVLAGCIGAALWFAVPLQPAGETARAASAVPLAQAAQVDLNSAGVEELCTLPGIGESKARAIVAYRVEHGHFASVDEAANVPGVTQAVVESWAGLACAGKTPF